jgi:hypothetical protein
LTGAWSACLAQVSGEPEEFYYPEGSWLPPTGRARKQLLTFVVIIAVNFVSIFVSMESWKVAVGMMKPGDYMVGAIAYGLANAVVSTVIDCIMDGVPQLDMKGFMSKLVSSRPLSSRDSKSWVYTPSIQSLVCEMKWGALDAECIAYQIKHAMTSMHTKFCIPGRGGAVEDGH